MSATWRLMIMNKNIRRVMYLSGDDFYLMTYLILVSLNYLIGPNSKSKKFKDHRKLIVIVQLLSDSRYIDVLTRYSDKKITNSYDKDFIFKSFSESELHKREANKLLQVMEIKGYISLEETNKTGVYDVIYKHENVPGSFIDSDIFSTDYESIQILKSNIRSLNTITFETFIERVYRDNGVNAWVL